MKILLLHLFLPVIVLAQTELYLSVARAPFLNGCEAYKDSFPVRCGIAGNITIGARIWNPDSLAWCTNEGRSRSQISGFLQWEIDGNSPDSFGTELTIPVLDTLEHKVIATYLPFPNASFRYKASNGLPFLICSKNVELFDGDSINMSIGSNYPATFDDASPIPAIRNATVMDDSLMRSGTGFLNSAIMTFNNPTDAAIKLVSFSASQLQNPNFNIKMTYSPVVNSYSILFPLAQAVILAKKRSAGFSDTTDDTIVAVFKRQSEFDTLRIRYTNLDYVVCPNCQPLKTGGAISFRKNEIGFRNGDYKVFDLRGCLVKRSVPVTCNSRLHAQPGGIYLFQENGREQIDIQPVFTVK
jgi:hypothetical protein